MNRKIIVVCIGIVFIYLLSTGCKKFLTVQPNGQYTEDQVYTKEVTVQQALNGLYNNLTDNSLYGANLSGTTIDLMGQYWNVASTSDNNYSLLQTYAYTQASVTSTFDDIWQKTYSNVLAANKFISKVDTALSVGVLTQDKANEMKGEAIAIRAFLHLDMLRLFGPVYSTSADQPAIPYYRHADGNAQPIITAKQAIDSLIKDFSDAETLLVNDPIRQTGVVFSQDFYSGYRNKRMNYYAVKGLLALTHLWAGNTIAAHDSAKAVIAEGEKWFPWAVPAAINNGVTPDRIFSPEVLFSINNQTMYTSYTSFYSPDLKATSLLAPLTARLSNLYESNSNDYRFSNWFLSSFYFQKFKDIASTTAPWRFSQPIIRKSELYYIIAETEADPTTAFAALSLVRNARGLLPLSTTATLRAEITKEYQKEFWGEGQVFYYYKRINATSIPSATSATGNVSMNATKYVVPLPLSETTPR